MKTRMTTKTLHPFGFAALLFSLIATHASAAAPGSALTTTEAENAPHLPRIVLNADPIGLLSGIFGGEIGIRVSRKWVVSGQGRYLQRASAARTFDAWEYGGSADYYFAGHPLLGGWYFGSGMYYQKTKIARSNGSFRVGDSERSWAWSFLGSHEWVWNCGLRGALGAGVTFNLSDQTHSTEPTLRAQVGWVF